ncbi:putative two-component response regulator-like APRR8 [Impatiens glandulifera]|uniref:putative two-component response regulator-like APRR8 n=1 Tax=Impatiens glandulifera TaxID=253017 RepID=UPI001FB05FFB|nr:putative two-component response regulator-like APRR8 [Impatiens glandulifera]
MRKKKKKASWRLINLEGCPDRLGHAREEANTTTHRIETPKRKIMKKKYTHVGAFERESNMILLYDSDRSSVERTEALLASCQYKVIVAERASEALSMVGESRRGIDIVLTEFDLPDMDGLMFIEKVLEIKKLPVFVLSAFENLEVQMYCLLNGAEFCYDKPLNKVNAQALCEFIVPRSGSSATSEISYNILDSPVSINADMHIVDDLILENHEEVVADNFLMISNMLDSRWISPRHRLLWYTYTTFIIIDLFRMALRFKVQEQINYPGLNLNLDQNVVGTSRDENVNKNHT